MLWIIKIAYLIIFNVGSSYIERFH